MSLNLSHTPKHVYIPPPSRPAVESEPKRIHKIIDERQQGQNTFYKIRWRCSSDTQDTWEPLKVVEQYKDALWVWEGKKWLTTARKRPCVDPEPSSGSRKAFKSIKHVEESRASTVAEISAGMKGTTVTAEQLGRSISTNSCRDPTAGSNTNAQHNPPSASLGSCSDLEIFLQKLSSLKGPEVELINELDDDSSPPTDFEFIDSLRLAPDVKRMDPAFIFGCDCPSTGCTNARTCCCLEDYDQEPKGRRFSYNKHGRVIRDNRVCIIECNRNCSCGPECRNRVVQNGRKIRLQIFKTENKGWGLRSPEPLKKGTLIDLYLGEVIGPEEAERRAKKASKRGISYLFDLDKFALDENEDEGAVGRSGLPLDEEDPTVYTVDGQYYGGVTRFVNHSCDPNLWVYAVMSDRRDGKVYDLALFTNRAIPAYEELTFCYVKTSEPEDKGTVTWPCYCGSVNCVEKLW